jgi:hypothetical protein
MRLSLVPFRAGVGTPAGSVTFAIDGSAVATVPLSGSVASYTYQSSSLTVGSHSISAVYNGDANFVPGYFGAQHQVIPILYPTTIALTANPASALAAQTISFHAQVSSVGQMPYGTVSFFDGTTPLGSVLLESNSLGVFDTSLLSPGTHSITAHFLGNQDFAPATSSPVTITISVTKTTTSLTASPGNVSAGSTVLLTATVASSSGTPSGSVIFYDGGTPLQNTVLDKSGVAAYGAVFSTAGTHTISASYLANSHFASSTSPTVNLTIAATPASNATFTVLTGTASTAVTRGFDLTARVKAARGIGSGQVIFRDGSTGLGIAPLDESGTATYDSLSLSPGLHYINAYFLGSTTFRPSASEVLVESIPSNVPDFSMSVSPGSAVIQAGGSVEAEITVASLNGFKQDVTLGCSTTTPYLACRLQFAKLAGGGGSSRLTVSRTDPTGASSQGGASPLTRNVVFWIPPLLLSALFLKRARTFALVALLALCTACSGTVLLSPLPTIGNYIVTVTGISSHPSTAITHAVSLSVKPALR